GRPVLAGGRLLRPGAEEARAWSGAHGNAGRVGGRLGGGGAGGIGVIGRGCGRGGRSRGNACRGRDRFGGGVAAGIGVIGPGCGRGGRSRGNAVGGDIFGGSSGQGVGVEFDDHQVAVLAGAVAGFGVEVGAGQGDQGVGFALLEGRG